MALHLPLCVRVKSGTLDRRDAFFASILRALRPSPADAAFAVHAFAFKNDEQRFARALLAQRTELWLFRANQRAFCGDFLAVDMSSPAASHRRAFVLELKLGAPLRLGRGGVQLRNAERAVRDVVGTRGEIGIAPSYEVITGDGERILRWLAGPRRRRPQGDPAPRAPASPSPA